MDDIEPALRRARRRTTWLVALGAVLGGIGGVVLTLTTDSGAGGVLVVAGFACTVGGIAGAVSLLATLSGLLPALQVPLDGLDPASRRTVERSIRSGQPITPADGELALRGADRARGLEMLLPYQTAQFVLLYVGIGGSQLSQLISDYPWQFWFSRIFLVAIVVTGGLVVVFTHRKVAAARRYLEAVRAQGASNPPVAGPAPSAW